LLHQVISKQLFYRRKPQTAAVIHDVMPEGPYWLRLAKMEGCQMASY